MSPIINLICIGSAKASKGMGLISIEGGDNSYRGIYSYTGPRDWNRA